MDPVNLNDQARISRGVAFGPQAPIINYKPEVRPGDSLWSILNKILLPRISSLDKAGQIFTLSTISDIVLKSRGSISVGEKLDFSTLFNDEQRIKSILERATKLGDAQKASILENNKKISNWLISHPVVEVSLSKVSEILSQKETPKPAPVVQPIIKAEMPKTEIPKPKLPPITAATTTPPVAVKSLMGDADMASKVDQAFKAEVDSVYGKSGLFKKTPGTETEEWKFIKSLAVSKVMKYFTGDSAGAGFSRDQAEALAKSPKHQELIKQLAGLMKETKEVVKPYENETVEQFLRRLGKYVMENHFA